MRRRRHLITRLDRLDPPTTYGGVVYLEDLEEGLVVLEDIPPGCGGYLIVPRPCTVEEWVTRYEGARYPVPERS